MSKRHLDYWPKRLPTVIDPPATSLCNNLAMSARCYPHKPALIFLDHIVTYEQLASEVEKLARALARFGVRKGDRVLLDMQNCPQHVVAHFAILRANAVVVPVNPMNRAEEITHYILDSGAKVALTTGDLAAEVAAASDLIEPEKRLAHLVVTQFADAFGEDQVPYTSIPPQWQKWLFDLHELPSLDRGLVHHWREVAAYSGEPPPLLSSSHDLAVMPYTSGTTGKPKGCMHTHASLMHNAVASHYWLTSSMQNVMLCVTPLFHITGIVMAMHSTIYSGGTLVIMPRWDRDFAAQQIAAWKVSHWINIPTMIVDLLGSPNLGAYDLSSLVFVGGGGAAMPKAVAERLEKIYGLRYVEGYGLTETAAPCHFNPLDAPKLQCLGIPYIGVEARLLQSGSALEVVGGGEGEIVVSSPSLFSGYWQKPKATEDSFVVVDGKRFFRTGDIGRVDEDGYFFMTDRLKRMINASGFKVWPAEVEALMYKHPAIQEACVIGTKDEYRGESAVAVVVLRDGANVGEAELLAWCRENMAVYKAPRSVRFVESLPKSASGKVLWRVLQEAESA